MANPSFNNLFSLQRLLAGLSGVCFGLVVTRITNFFAALPWWVAAIAAIFALITWGLSLAVDQKPSDIDVVIHSPQTIRTHVDVLYYARAGFVGFVPLFNPKRESSAAQLSMDERLDAARNLDFERLHLEESNLEPTIKAIRTHAQEGTLKHCWLLATVGQNAPGSLPYARLLAEYLSQEGLGCEFHYGDRYTIPLDDDALVLSKTYDLVKRVLEEANQLKITARDLVADITTGFRSMTLGMVLACLSRERDIEFIGTRYNEAGMPDRGGLTPIIFSFEPDVKPGI